MARDYKYRAQDKHSTLRNRTSGREKPVVGVWKWMLITALIITFVVFLVYLGTKKEASAPAAVNNVSVLTNKSEATAVVPVETKKPDTPAQSVKPQFDFYTILPAKEIVVPDYEIKTRAREERVGKAKQTKYILQAGSFKEFKEADQLRAKLALMGIESRVEKTKVGNVTWSRVKLGPYLRMSSVSSIRERLRQNGIDVVVTETGG